MCKTPSLCKFTKKYSQKQTMFFQIQYSSVIYGILSHSTDAEFPGEPS